MDHIGTTMTALADTHFDRTTALVADGAGRFAVRLDESWASLRGVHGGYLTALAVRAAEATVLHREVRTVTTSFLRPAAVGPAELDVDVVRSGRSFGTLSVSLRQGGRMVTSTRITMLETVTGHDWTGTVPDLPAPREQCVPFSPPPTIRHFTQAELLIDPSTIPTGDSLDARIAGHVRPNELRPLDAAWLAMIGDWFPPSPFRRLMPPTGGVSIDYTVHVHRTMPADPELWVQGVFEAKNSAGGIALEHGVICSPGGAPLAETFHSRWTG